MALPTYAMSCFRIPKKICEGLLSIIAQFWWRNKAQGNGLHWTSWKSMSKPKKEGGLGFKDLEAFNTALLGKQLWRMLTEPDSLLSRLYKSRYFVSLNPLTAPLGARPSFAWRGIWSSQELLKKGTRLVIGSRNNPGLWSEPWLPSIPPRPPRPLLLNQNLPRQIGELLLPNSPGWNLPMLQSVIHQDDVALVSAVYIGINNHRDRYIWSLAKNGKYSVRSGYWTETHLSTYTRDTDTIYGPNINPLFEGIWKLNTSQKLKHFLWRCLSNNVATAANLKYRHLSNDSRCPRCGAANETIHHILFACPYARLVWTLANSFLREPVSPENSLLENIFIILFKNQSAEGTGEDPQTIIPWLIWRIWKARNEFCFSCTDLPPHKALQIAQEDAATWKSATENRWRLHNENRRPPNPIAIQYQETTDRGANVERFTCFTDGAWKNGNGVCGMGWIVFKGETFWSGGSMAMPCLPNALMTEAMALRWALDCIKSLNIHQVDFKTDAQHLVMALQNTENWPSLQPTLSEIEALLSSLSEGSLLFIPRHENSSADALASYGLNLSPYNFQFFNVIPEWMKPIMKVNHPNSVIG